MKIKGIFTLFALPLLPLSLGTSLFSKVNSPTQITVVVAIESHDHSTMTPWTSSNSLPSAPGNYYLNTDVTITSSWNVPVGETYLCLNGHLITGSGVEHVILFRKSLSATLTIDDHNNEGGITGGHSTGGLKYGAGVFVPGDEGQSNIFNLNGGRIFGNTFTANNSGGGGVGIEQNGVFNMYGGIIHNNEAAYGGGVYGRFATFNMYGGEIRDNRAYATDGGGVHVWSELARANIYGGTIKNNTAHSGGGIGVSGGAQLYLAGGNITGNKAEVGGGVTNKRTSGGGMAATFTMSGNPSIKGNTNLEGDLSSNFYLFKESGDIDPKIELVDALSNDVTNNKISVSLSTEEGILVKNWSTYMNNKNPSNYFEVENSSYQIFTNELGEAEIAPQAPQPPQPPQDHDENVSKGIPGGIIALIVILSILSLVIAAWALLMFVLNKWIKIGDKAVRAFKLFGLKNKEGKYIVWGFPFKFVTREETEIFKTKEEASK